MKNKTILFIVLFVIIIISIYNSFSKNTLFKEGYRLRRGLGYGGIRYSIYKGSREGGGGSYYGLVGDIDSIGEGGGGGYYQYPNEQLPVVYDQLL